MPSVQWLKSLDYSAAQRGLRVSLSLLNGRIVRTRNLNNNEGWEPLHALLRNRWILFFRGTGGVGVASGVLDCNQRVSLLNLRPRLCSLDVTRW